MYEFSTYRYSFCMKGQYEILTDAAVRSVLAFCRLVPKQDVYGIEGTLYFHTIYCVDIFVFFVFRCRWDNGLKMSRNYSLLPPLSVLALFLPVCLSVQKAGQSSMWSQVCMQISDKLQVHQKTHFQCILEKSAKDYIWYGPIKVP